MNINQAFNELIKNNIFNYDNVSNTISAICKKLNSVYYDSNSQSDHLILAGSAGRKTYIHGSDIDCCFILPLGDYYRFQNRKGNIQSQLLAEIANKVKSKYPNSDISADGQVVVADFEKILIEIVPCFKLNVSSDELIYPDSHNDGKWLTTNPRLQKQKVEEIQNTYPTYLKICQILRCWRLENSVDISGIVIDSLVYYFLNKKYEQKYKEEPSSFDYLEILKEIFGFMGSNFCPDTIQIIGETAFKDTNKKKFNKKANRAQKLLSEANISVLWDNLIQLFGNGFPDNPAEKVKNNSEAFIQNMFPINIQNKLTIDCYVSRDGFSTFKILDKLMNNTAFSFFVPRSTSLRFYIKECDVQHPYRIYWKVRNVGKKAREKNDIRGEIVLGDETHKEKSVFHGPHYVECFIVKDGICVARDKITVPIEE